MTRPPLGSVGERALPRARTAGVLLALCLAAPAAQQTPVFRAAVDLIAIDVVVLDSSGAPVPTLTAADFAVTAGGTPRRVVSADYVGSTRPVRGAAAARAPAASSNQSATAPRGILIVVDVEQIPTGAGRLAMKSLGTALDRLGPGDRVGLMTLSDTRVALTDDRVRVRRALDGLAGTSNRLRDREMTFGEAVGIAARDRAALQAYWNRVVDQGFARPGDRTCAPPRTFDTLRDVPADCVQFADAALDRARLVTARVLERLRQIAAALTFHAGPRAIVFVSGGLVNDTRTRKQLEAFAAAAERAHVSVHTLLIEAEGGMGGRSSFETSRYDSRVGLGGLADLAAAARGSAHRVHGDAGEAFARIDRALSGHYVVSVERLDRDQDDERIAIDVRVARPGLRVLAGAGVTPTGRQSIADAVADARSGVADLLGSPRPARQVAIDVDAFVLPDAGSRGDARAIVVVEVDRDPAAVAALGFQLAESSGRVIADGYESPAKMLPAGAGRSRFITTVPVGAGRFVGRFAAIDADGRSGSVEHTFETPAAAGRGLQPSDVIFGERTANDFQPIARVPSEAGTLPVRLVLRDASGRFDGIGVRAAITHARDDSHVDLAPVTITPTPDPLRRFADADLRLDGYPPGEYVVTLIVSAGGTEIARRARLFAVR